jgi:hypothetical protein
LIAENKVQIDDGNISLDFYMSKLPVNRSLSPSKPVFRQPRASTGFQQINPNGGDSPSRPLRVGDRVSHSGKSGTVAYIGRTQFSEGLIYFNY